MKFILIILFSIVSFAYAETPTNYCGRSISEYIPYACYGNKTWTIASDGKIKRFFNIDKNNDSNCSFEEVDDKTIKVKLQSTLNIRTAITIISLDAAGRVSQIKEERIPDDHRRERIVKFNVKNGICYPEFATSDTIRPSNPEIKGIIATLENPKSKQKEIRLQFDTSLCRELSEYFNRNREVMFKCSCGTDKTNKVIMDIINSHDEVEWQGEKVRVDRKGADQQGIFSFIDIKEMNATTSPMHQAWQYLSQCDHPGVRDAVRDDSLWKEEPAPSSKIGEQGALPVKVR